VLYVVIFLKVYMNLVELVVVKFLFGAIMFIESLNDLG